METNKKFFLNPQQYRYSYKKKINSLHSISKQSHLTQTLSLKATQCHVLIMALKMLCPWHFDLDFHWHCDRQLKLIVEGAVLCFVFGLLLLEGLDNVWLLAVVLLDLVHWLWVKVNDHHGKYVLPAVTVRQHHIVVFTGIKQKINVK